MLWALGWIISDDSSMSQWEHRPPTLNMPLSNNQIAHYWGPQEDLCSIAAHWFICWFQSSPKVNFQVETAGIKLSCSICEFQSQFLLADNFLISTSEAVTLRFSHDPYTERTLDWFHFTASSDPQPEAWELEGTVQFLAVPFSFPQLSTFWIMSYRHGLLYWIYSKLRKRVEKNPTLKAHMG